MHPQSQHGFHPVFCTIVPPQVLDRLSQSDNPDLAGPARRTLEGDAARRTRRQMATVVTV
ncbi:peptidase M4 family protein, partial [Streptomyces mirabilis]